MSRQTVLILLLFAVIACALLPTANAFGAGNIPSYSAMEGSAFRHGDLADAIAQLSKKTGGIFGKGSKFSAFEIKQVYLGNWLRDVSCPQAKRP